MSKTTDKAIDQMNKDFTKAVETMQLILDRQESGVDYRDLELDHQRADHILLEVLTSFGCGKLVEIYKQIDKWYA